MIPAATTFLVFFIFTHGVAVIVVRWTDRG
jgi:hypothetical protein